MNVVFKNSNVSLEQLAMPYAGLVLIYVYDGYFGLHTITITDKRNYKCKFTFHVVLLLFGNYIEQGPFCSSRYKAKRQQYDSFCAEKPYKLRN